jgi:phage-related protein
MNEPILQVRFFVTVSGSEPVRDWLRELPVLERKIIGTDIKTVQFGWPLDMPLVRKMEGDLWEVRIHLVGADCESLFHSLWVGYGASAWVY